MKKLSMQSGVVVAASLLLAACGGTTVSFPSASGVVATGLPLVGVQVTATDVHGLQILSTPTDAQGHYQLTLSGQFPYVLTVPASDADGTPVVLSTVISADGAASNPINPLTSLITQRLLGTTLQAAPPAAQIEGSHLDVQSVQQVATQVTALWAPLFSAFGVSSQVASAPLTTSYVADPTQNGLDKLFDQLRIELHTGEVKVGVDAAAVTLHIPAQGAIDTSAQLTPAAVQSALAQSQAATATPIQHLIVVVGENHTFDALFGAYQPTSGQSVLNLLSQGIIQADGSPGPNYALAEQSQAVPSATYSLNLARQGYYSFLPQPMQIGIVNYNTLQTAGGVVDSNFPANLPPGPFQVTHYVSYGAATGPLPQNETGDPVHRFFQMWQQTNGDNSVHDLFTWVAVNAGQGAMTTGVTAADPGQGGELMGFFNMSQGDAPYFKGLADQFAISDNYHQGIMGGTGMNFFYLATGDLPVYNDKNSTVPDATQIENPNPQPGTPDLYRGDGYNGGSYVNCSDAQQPGVAVILQRLAQLNTANSRCDKGAYYLVNNYNPAYNIHGQAQPVAPGDSGYSTNSLAYPPQTLPNIADLLGAHGVSWSWFTGGTELADLQQVGQAFAQAHGLSSAQLQALLPVLQNGEINLLGDALLGFPSIVTQPANFAQLKGLTSFYNEVSQGTLPAVSFVVPMNTASGHPGYSEPAEYEAFLQQLIPAVQANPSLWAHTAIIVTTDEGGGHFDSGSIQNLDFFGDGPRIPMLVISPYARVGHVDHVYEDHASILKFIERNWRLPTLSTRSRDNLPNPVVTADHPYQPVNKPALGDLMTLFDF